MLTIDPINREVLRHEITRDEGLRLKPYRCTAGKLTVGVGRNLDDVGLSREELAAFKTTMANVRLNGVTRPQAMTMLDNDIDRCLAEIERALPWASRLDEVRLRVVINMAFNLGIVRLLGFRNTLKFMETGQYAQAASNMLKSLWARQVGERAHRLSELMRLGARKPA